MNKKALAVLMVLVFVASSMAVVVGNSNGSQAADGKTVVVETSPDFAPYDYYYGTEFAGIDMDILRAIAKDTGLNIQFRQNNFDSIILSVTQGKCDFGASGFTISEERKKSVDFTDSYAVIKQVVVAKVGKDITSEDDVKGKTIAAQTGTSGADYAETLTSDVDFQKGYPEIILDLLNGKADCEIVDDAVAEAQVSSYPTELKIYDVLDAEPEYYGFVFAKGSPLYDTINNSLIKLKNDGTVAKITQYYADNGYSPNTPSYYNQEPTLYVLGGTDSPYGYQYNGKNAGIETDILNAVAKKTGMRFSVVHPDDDAEKTEWLTRIIDTPSFVGAAGFSSSADLGSGYIFTDSYSTDTFSILSLKGSPVTDLTGKNVAFISCTSAETYIEGKGAASTVSCEDSVALAYAVLNGEADCAVVTTTVAESCITQNPNKFESSEIEGTSVSLAFVCSADASSLVEKINDALKALKDDGTIDKIVKHYADSGYSLSVNSYYDNSAHKSFWEDLYDKFVKDFLEKDRYQYILKGLGNTLAITAIALVIGTVIGVLVAAVMSVYAMSGRLRIPNAVCKVYVTIIRGTPVMVQLLLIYYVIFATANMNQILIAAVAFGLNSGAYVAEIVRSGINSVPKGQMEAARSLGLDMRTSMTSVVVPQAIRNILPALGNEGISLIKETSIAGYIGLMDLTRAADIIRGQTYDALLPLLVIAAIYLAIVLVLQFFIRKMERRLNSAY